MGVVAVDGVLTEHIVPESASSGHSEERLELATKARAPLEARGLFVQHYGSVRRLLRRFGVTPASVDDAAQEVFWVAVRRLVDIEPGREKAFLYGVALRVASNEVRRQSAKDELATSLEAVEHQLAHVSATPEESLAQRRALMLLQAVLDRMPLELRTVFVLFELEGLEVAKIAELQELPLGTASSRLRRARAEFSAISQRVRCSLERGKVTP